MVMDRQLEAASEDGDYHGVLLSMAAARWLGLRLTRKHQSTIKSSSPSTTNKAAKVRGNNGQQQNGSGGVAWLGLNRRLTAIRLSRCVCDNSEVTHLCNEEWAIIQKFGDMSTYML
ncbi:hypothetical protein PHJA_000670900 [Phtheirospermum japonicum]|uniref:Uncharacterized protein n=1 Tax=Phtheirospermum japonicum TaxID=374723 RepID=A0A830BGG7_9LAMI|nr:hypothetical protein PHJA_000670900 [Phtheirospermum japonicum]